MKKESPHFVKISQATAISLGLIKGRMYRGAVNRCVNLLVHFPEGCSANCAYCGLAKKRRGTYKDKSFINVAWPVYPIEDVISAINNGHSYIGRSCISMITNKRSRKATFEMAQMLKNTTVLPISVLIAPTIIYEQYLVTLKDIGVDKIGIAIDLANSELFDRYRGRGVSGPHKWEKYWRTLEIGIRIFGSYNVGAHLMAGMGETEQEITSIMDRLWQMGIVNHLFSFFPEKGSRLEQRPQPLWSTYLRIQLARYLIEEDLSCFRRMKFDEHGRISDFGIDSSRLSEIINLGIPFMTTGCLGPDGDVSCNRPFGNCLPDVRQWNYPFQPNQEELDLIGDNIFRIEPDQQYG